MNKVRKLTSIRHFLLRHFWRLACASWVVRPSHMVLPARVATLLTSSLLGLGAYAQGTVNFANLGGGVDQPIYFSDWTTKVPPGFGFTVELLAGSSAASLTTVATTGFTEPGYFDGGVVTIAGLDSGSPATFQIRVWTTSSGSYSNAVAAGFLNTFGASAPFVVTLGGAGQPPGPPARLSTFQSISLGWDLPDPSQKFYCRTKEDTIEIAGYHEGTNTEVVIPSTIGGLPVTSIGNGAFAGKIRVHSVVIPDTVLTLENGAFGDCLSLAVVSLGRSVTNIGNFAFNSCFALTSVAIPDDVTSIGEGAFEGCSSLTNVTIGSGVLRIQGSAFQGCTNLTTAYFKGNAPAVDPSAFQSNGLTIYYLPGTTGWGPTFLGFPTVLWNPAIQSTGPGFGMGPNGFGFIITGTSNIQVSIEASTSLINSSWSLVGTRILSSGSAYFSEFGWTNYPTRYYRVRSP